MSPAPWHLLERLERGKVYRLTDGSTLTFVKIDGMCALTSEGPYYLGPFLREMLDLTQFEEAPP